MKSGKTKTGSDVIIGGKSVSYNRNSQMVVSVRIVYVS